MSEEELDFLYPVVVLVVEDPLDFQRLVLVAINIALVHEHLGSPRALGVKGDDAVGALDASARPLQLADTAQLVELLAVDENQVLVELIHTDDVGPDAL